jgi:small-conductance mechanosensitive channel
MPALSPLFQQALVAAPAALAIVVGAIALNMLVGRALRFIVDKANVDHEAVDPLAKLVRWLVNVGAVVLLLGVLGFNLGGLWAMMATVLGMVAIGFVAVWSVLSNVLCTFMILLYRPFEVGDEVEIASEGVGVGGKVAALNFLYTTLNTADGALLQIPNNLFFQKVVKRRRGNGRASLSSKLNLEEPIAAEPVRQDAAE